MRSLYTLVFSALIPLIVLRLFWRGRKAPAYRQRWHERLGFYQTPSAGNVLWFHAVSVGEAEAAFPLIQRLQTQLPDQAFLVTTTTPTGSARVKAVLADTVEHVYLPYDLPWIVGRFLRHFQPKVAIVMEKEIWPNLFASCAQRQVPVLVINARLSAKSAKAYRKIPALIKPALSTITQIATQTAADRQRFIEIGAQPEQVTVLGNIKFDLTVEASLIQAGALLKQQLFAGRFVWIIASTHQGEEEQLLSLYKALKVQIPNLLLLIAPRHPERFGLVKQLCQKQGLQVELRSEQAILSPDCDVYLADSIGELKMLYAAADIAFVGGSLVPVGGHNVLEPAAVGLPVMFGSQMFNFQEIAEQMLIAKAAIQCQDELEIAKTVLHLEQDQGFRAELAANAKAFVANNQGATARVAGLITESI